MSCAEALRAWADRALSSGIPAMRNGFNLSLTKLNQQVRQHVIRYAR
jgi:hypothetical protein